MRRAIPTGAALLPLALAACTPGPQHPTTDIALAPPVTAATIAPVSGAAQQIVPDATVSPDWWRQFASPQLDALVERALAANNDLASAEAALRQARQQAAATFGASLPQIDASFQPSRTRTSRTFSNPLQDPNEYLYSLHTAQVTVSYQLDVFGQNRTKVRSARAAADVATDKLVAARTTVIANLVTAVIQRASIVAQIDAANRAIQSNTELLGLLNLRQQLGDIGLQDVAAQQTALATAQGVLPGLLRQRTQQDSLISVLIGVAPGSPLPALPTLADLTLPGTLPVALPAQIVANRPDVRAAEAQMRGAAADVGTAIAARLPSFPLTANLGGTAEHIGDMFASGNPFYALIGSVTQPIFHGGQLLHQQRAAEAALDGAKAQYRGVALQAFSDVANALAGLRSDADALDAASRASDAAERNLTYTRRQLELGGVGTLVLLNAAASSAQAAGQLVQARAARLADTVALFQAVGGGVDNRIR
jgi:NodT family efflux transporter outer membrane factor (OMF) lipoprotein